MRIRYLSLTNFRNYSRLELTLPDRPLLLHGANAQGKTSLLEAVYLLATGSSPLTSVDRQLLRWQTGREALSYTRVWAEVERSDGIQELEVVIEKQPLANGTERMQKTIRLNRVRKRRADLAGKLNVVLFMPQDMDIIAGSPSRRRRYLDETLCQVDAAYARAVARYADVLRQRNATLRHLRDAAGDRRQLAPFEETLAHEGALIATRRHDVVAALSARAGRIHRDLTGRLEWLRLTYVSNFDPETATTSADQLGLGLDVQQRQDAVATNEDLVAAYRRALEARRPEEIARGMTLVGPHRDELRFVCGSPSQGTHAVDLGTFGSRGQQRTAVLALKLAQMEWMRDQTQETPVLLLDEVLAELDASRRRYLLDRVDGVEQALLTATDPAMFSPEFRARAAVWEVEAGVVTTS